MAPKKNADGEEREAKKVTPKQQELLMQLLLERPRLGKGKLDRTFTNLDKKKQWLEVIDLIHAAGLGPMKTYEKWTKCWQDLKSKIKGKKAAIGKSRRLTGGGEESILELTPLEKKNHSRVFQQHCCLR